MRTGTRRSTARDLSRFLFAVLVATGVTAACHPEGAPGPASVLGDSGTLRNKLLALLQSGPVLNWKYLLSDSISFWPNSVHCQTNCGSWTPNTNTVLVKFPRLAQAVGVTGEGPFKCSGSRPTVRAYSLSGTVVATVTMQITDMSDCGDDDMSGDLHAEISLSDSIIFYLEITAPSPWTWEVAIPGGTIPGRALVDYEARIVLPEAPPPVPDSICPPTGDALWDSLGVRSTLDSLFRRSGALEQPDTLRKEYVALIYRNPNGSLYIREPLYLLQNNCDVQWAFPPEFSLGILEPTLVSVMHVHPVRKGENQICVSPPAPHNNDFTDGFSWPDRLSMAKDAAARRNAGLNPLAHYVMDGDRVWTVKDFGFPGLVRNAWARRPIGCRWS